MVTFFLCFFPGTSGHLSLLITLPSSLSSVGQHGEAQHLESSSLAWALVAWCFTVLTVGVQSQLPSGMLPGVLQRERESHQ